MRKQEEALQKSTQVTIYLFILGRMLQEQQRGKALNKNVGRAVSGTVVGWWSSVGEEDPQTNSIIAPPIMIVSIAVNKHLFTVLPSYLQ